ncbi:PREDICTED: gibberellin 2-beta-dioxygenase 1 [Tarenaya hassleriana]|uniref:gibberellin 2-beta-dioxygenase 1 n=1 Tax=Tarenaya hassleriana TaxID=28532 RepID=UPI00053C7266|nr:PREDICTED: gibberellin 2-beta-dioxygenase 1 [Tarenaya hassleriana]
MASSSAHHHFLPNIHGGATAAPPPTPSTTQPNNAHFSSAASEASADALAGLLHRLPPSLSLPSRRRSTAPSSASLPAVSLAGDGGSSDDLLSAATESGYFDLTDCGTMIPSELAHSAESDSLSLFGLGEEQKETWLPKAWPLGYEAVDGEEAETGSFCLDADCSTEPSSELKLTSLREFTRALGEIGLKTVEKLASAVGFDNPFGHDPTRLCTFMWIHEGISGDKPAISGGFYPFVVCLQYQIREQKYCLMTESGWVTVAPRVDSVLVTLGDIAQVWSNGKLKKVRYRPVACSSQGEGDDGRSKRLTMSLLLTLPMDSRVSPLMPGKDDGDEGLGEEEEEEDGEKRVFRSFSFEDYAWRVYNERLYFKDPLDRYRTRL